MRGLLMTTVCPSIKPRGGVELVVLVVLLPFAVLLAFVNCCAEIESVC